MVEEIRTVSSQKVKAVFCSSGEKQTENWKDITPKQLYTFTGILISAGRNCGKGHI